MQVVIKYLFKTLIQGFIISIIIACVLISIEMVFGRDLSFDRDFITEIGYYCIYGVVLTLLSSGYFDYLNHRVVWNKYKKFRLLIGAIGSVFLTMVGVFFIRMFINVVLEKESMSTFFANEQPRYYIISLLITLIISLFFHTIYFYKKSQDNKVKEQQIIASTASAKFESLKSQIDPHFLFNSLNVLSSLIEENPENAQRFTTSLSKVYRYVLEQKDKELISVEEELSFAKTYMNLLKMRFENSLFYELPAQLPNVEAKVVPLSLQLLLENTVKHNIASEQKPLHIKIFFEGDYLVIENDLRKKEVLQDRRGLGLQNIIDRYGIVTNRKVLVEQDERTYKVKIPILTKQVSVAESNYPIEEENTYFKLKKKVDDIKGFYRNLASYIIFTTGFGVLNVLTSPEYLWFLYPAMGWGLGVLIHGLSVFNYLPFFGRDWEARKIKELMEKDRADTWK
jgi:hypothetical protein